MLSLFFVSSTQEYLPTSLHSYLREQHNARRPVAGPTAIHIARELAKGLNYLHNLKPPTMHRDCKSKNILIDFGPDDAIKMVKLCDFGVSKVLHAGCAHISVTCTQHMRVSFLLSPHSPLPPFSLPIPDSSFRTQADTMVGTYYWMAPEVLAHNGGSYSLAADVWSYGMVLVEVLTAQPPYAECGGDWPKVRQLILSGQAPQFPSTAPSVLRSLIRSCLRKEPAQRPSMKDVLVQLAQF